MLKESQCLSVFRHGDKLSRALNLHLSCSNLQAALSAALSAHSFSHLSFISLSLLLSLSSLSLIILWTSWILFEPKILRLAMKQLSESLILIYVYLPVCPSYNWNTTFQSTSLMTQFSNPVQLRSTTKITKIIFPFIIPVQQPGSIKWLLMKCSGQLKSGQLRGTFKVLVFKSKFLP